MPPKKQPPESDSDRAVLDELLDERRFKLELRKRRIALFAGFRTWTTWIGGLGGFAAAVVTFKDHFMNWVKSWFA